jgi:hypothetical protein
MNTDKENIKDKIKDLSSQIRQAGEEEWEWMPYEWEIARLIIDYSIRHKIEIPLIKYDLYSKEREPIEEDQASKPIRRRKLDEIDLEEEVYRYREEQIYFDDFLEAIGEEGLTNPRFKIHPDIRELADCWQV